MCENVTYIFPVSVVGEGPPVGSIDAVAEVEHHDSNTFKFAHVSEYSSNLRLVSLSNTCVHVCRSGAIPKLCVVFRISHKTTVLRDGPSNESQSLDA